MQSNIDEDDKIRILVELNDARKLALKNAYYKAFGFRRILEITLQSYLGIEPSYYKLTEYKIAIENHPVLFKTSTYTNFKYLYNFFGSYIHPNLMEIDIKELQKNEDKLVKFLETLLEIEIEKDSVFDLNINSLNVAPLNEVNEEAENYSIVDNNIDSVDLSPLIEVKEEENNIVKFLKKVIEVYKQGDRQNIIAIENLRKKSFLALKEEETYKRIKFNKRPW